MYVSRLKLEKTEPNSVQLTEIKSSYICDWVCSWQVDVVKLSLGLFCKSIHTFNLAKVLTDPAFEL